MMLDARLERDDLVDLAADTSDAQSVSNNTARRDPTMR
jgi:hypothetical protein